jgi:hypothetical protein
MGYRCAQLVQCLARIRLLRDRYNRLLKDQSSHNKSNKQCHLCMCRNLVDTHYKYGLLELCQAIFSLLDRIRIGFQLE